MTKNSPWVSSLFVAAGLILNTPAVLSAPAFNGWNAGIASGSWFDWSSDLFNPLILGLPDRACVYPTATLDCSDPRRPHGTTTPSDLAPFTLIAGQQVETNISRTINGPMSSTMTMDVQSAGGVEGNISHVRIDLSVGQLNAFGYGLFSYGSVGNLLSFSGVSSSAPLYYYTEWTIDALLAGDARMSYDIRLGADGVTASDVAAGDLSGNFSGSVTGNSLSPSFFLGLATPAAAGLPGTSAVLDIWMTFSSEPVTKLPGDDPKPVPEPGSVPLLVLAAGLLAAVRVRTMGWRSA